MDARLAAEVTLLVLPLLLIHGVAGSENLWCYECNIDLRAGRASNCNDPYVPGHAASLVNCPRHEPHRCLKSIVLYSHVLVTVRGCVPSREINNYCWHEESFPGSRVECFFCKSNACNHAPSAKPRCIWTCATIAVIAIVLSSRET